MSCISWKPCLVFIDPLYSKIKRGQARYIIGTVTDMCCTTLDKGDHEITLLSNAEPNPHTAN